MRTSNKGFTLIELLTVIAIIAILVGLLFPAIKSSLAKAERAKAQTAVAGLATAFRAYYVEYGKWPNGTAGAQPVTTNLFSNTRNIVFYDFPAKDLDASGNYLDPWKQGYQCAFDTAYNNTISTPTFGTVNAGVMVWTHDGTTTNTTAKDYVTSW